MWSSGFLAFMTGSMSPRPRLRKCTFTQDEPAYLHGACGVRPVAEHSGSGAKQEPAHARFEQWTDVRPLPEHFEGGNRQAREGACRQRGVFAPEQVGRCGALQNGQCGLEKAPVRPRQFAEGPALQEVGNAKCFGMLAMQHEVDVQQPLDRLGWVGLVDRRLEQHDPLFEERAGDGGHEGLFVVKVAVERRACDIGGLRNIVQPHAVRAGLGKHRGGGRQNSRSVLHTPSLDPLIALGHAASIDRWTQNVNIELTSMSLDMASPADMTMPKPRPRRRGRRRWVWSAVLLAAVAAAAFYLKPTSVEATRVERGPLEQRMVVSGRVMPPARVDISSLVAGQITEVAVEEGQHVAARERLLHLDDCEALASVRRARAAVLQASARADQLERVGAVVASESLRQAEARVKKAQADLSRTTALRESGAVPPSELENAENGLEIAQSARDAALVQSLAASKAGTDTRVAAAALEQARAELETAQLHLERTQVVAPRAATVLTRSAEPGQVVQAGQALLSLALDGEVQLEIQPDERNLARLAVGQRALASADAFPDQKFDAVVSYIAPLVDAQHGTVDVRLKVPSPPAGLRPDMTISVDILVGRIADALVVPVECVRDPSSSPWVFQVLDGRTVRRDVQLGLRGIGMLQVMGGLAERDVVLVPRGQKLSEGQRVSYSLGKGGLR